MQPTAGARLPTACRRSVASPRKRSSPGGRLALGAIVRICLYQQKREALEAAGLSEYAMSQENVEIVRGTPGSNLGLGVRPVYTDPGLSRG